MWITKFQCDNCGKEQGSDFKPVTVSFMKLVPAPTEENQVKERWDRNSFCDSKCLINFIERH
jgi:hypothetical protein